MTSPTPFAVEPSPVAMFLSLGKARGRRLHSNWTTLYPFDVNRRQLGVRAGLSYLPKEPTYYGRRTGLVASRLARGLGKKDSSAKWN
jgi:hypothetical protein